MDSGLFYESYLLWVPQLKTISATHKQKPNGPVLFILGWCLAILAKREMTFRKILSSLKDVLFRCNMRETFFRLEYYIWTLNQTLDLVGLVTSWGSSNNHSSYLQVSLGQVKVRRVRAPRSGQKYEKSYCDYLKKSMMSPNRRAPKKLKDRFL